MKPTRVHPAADGRRLRDALAAVAIAAAAIVVPVLGPARVAGAQECAVTDLTCLAGSVSDPVNDVDQTAGDAANAAQGTASQTVHDVRDAIDGLTGSGNDPGGGGSSGDGGSGSGGGGPIGDGGGHLGAPSGGGGRPTPLAGASVLTREGSAPSTQTAIDGPGATGGPARPPDRSTGVGTRLTDVATGVAVPLLIVLGAVLLFTAVQDRLDRREPRLALAPVTGDLVNFE
jgi:hypothetical protein